MSYPPLPTLMVAPPVAEPRFTSPPMDLEDCLETPKKKWKGKGKGKKGGPSIPGSVQDTNRSFNIQPGPVPALLGARFVNGEWEHDNSF